MRNATRAPTKKATKADLKRLFENSVWHATAGTVESPKKQQATFTFLKDGSFQFTPADNPWGWDHMHYYEVAAPDVLKLYINNPANPKNRKIPFQAFRVDFGAKTARTDMTLGGTASTETFIEYEKPLK